MIIIISLTTAFLGGVYVGARYQSRIRNIWYSIFSK